MVTLGYFLTEERTVSYKNHSNINGFHGGEKEGERKKKKGEMVYRVGALMSLVHPVGALMSLVVFGPMEKTNAGPMSKSQTIL